MNPAFVVSSKIKDLNLVLNDLKASVDQNSWATTKHKGHAVELASGFSSSHDLVVAIGGDGTLHEVVNGVMKSSIESSPSAIGLIAKGSGNDFARAQKISYDLQYVLSANDSKLKKVDIGEIHFEDQRRRPSTRFFINIADCGLGAEVVQKMESGGTILSQAFGSRLKYGSAILQTFLGYQSKQVKVEMDNMLWEGKILLVAIGNSSCFGDGLYILPDARPDDGKFAVAIANLGIVVYLRNLSNLKKGRPIRHSGASYHQTSSVKIRGGPELLTEADGELICSGNVEFRISNRKLGFLY